MPKRKLETFAEPPIHNSYKCCMTTDERFEVDRSAGNGILPAFDVIKEGMCINLEKLVLREEKEV